jgi:hypothetical protein
MSVLCFANEEAGPGSTLSCDAKVQVRAQPSGGFIATYCASTKVAQDRSKEALLEAAKLTCLKRVATPAEMFLSVILPVPGMLFPEANSKISFNCV